MSKLIGSIRTLDALGRIVIPSEIRYALDWNDRDNVSIMMDGETVILKKFTPETPGEKKARLIESLKAIEGLNDSDKEIIEQAINLVNKY